MTDQVAYPLSPKQALVSILLLREDISTLEDLQLADHSGGCPRNS